MKLLKVLASLSPRVQLQVRGHLTTDLRHYNETPWRTRLRLHRERRQRECRKVRGAVEPGLARRQA